MTFSDLFKVANASVIPFWLLLALAPRSRWTWRLVHSGAPMLALAACYAALLVWGLTQPPNPDGGFGSLEGVMALFSQPAAVLIGWIHYLAFDLMVGAWIGRDALRHGVWHPAVVVTLFFTLMFGPVGLLLYALVRRKRAPGWALGAPID